MSREIIEDRGSRRIGKVFFYLLATIFLGVIGNALWELLFRPGINRFGSYLTSIFTTVDNAVFTTAALDPRPIPDLIILLVLVSLPLLQGMWFIEIGFLKPFIRNRLNLIEKKRGINKFKHYIVKKIRFNSIIGFTLSLIFFSGAFFAYLVQNEAVLVWRVFHRNLAICFPHMTQREQHEIIAQFRLMNNRADYQIIIDSLNKKAKAHAFSLKWHKKTPNTD